MFQSRASAAFVTCFLLSVYAEEIWGKTYVLPVLRYGPSNQRRDLRFLLAVAKELDMGFIPQGIHMHYLDRGHGLAKQFNHLMEKQKVDTKQAVKRKIPELSKGHRQLLRSNRAESATEASVSTANSSTLDTTRCKMNVGDVLCKGQAVDTCRMENLPDWIACIERDEVAGPPELYQQGCAYQQNDVARSRLLKEEGGGPGDEGGVTLAAENSLPNCLANRVKHYMEFDELFDRSFMGEYVDVKTVEELKAQGWDGQVDAVLQSLNERLEMGLKGLKAERRYLDMVLGAAGVQLKSNVQWLHGKHNLAYQGKLVQDLKNRLSKFRVVAVMGVYLTDWMHFDIKAAHIPGVVAPARMQGCIKSYWEANRRLRASPRLMDAAQRYIDVFNGEAFVAVQIRPFPDSCLLAWSAPGPLNASHVAKGCAQQHRTLDSLFRKCMSGFAQKYDTTNLFIMAHPSIRAKVTSLVQQASPGIVPRFLSTSDLPQYTKCHESSVTFLAMVEDVIAVQADFFIGTVKSSITDAIVQQRAAANRTRNTYLDTAFDSCAID